MVTLEKNTFARFKEARKQSYADLKRYRQRYLEAVLQYAGHRYGIGSTSRPVTPLNKTKQLVDTYLRHLVAQNPQVIVRSSNPSLQWQGDDLEIVNNKRIKSLKLNHSLNDVVFDAIFGIGISKVGLQDSDEEKELNGKIYDPGKLFVTSISPNDFCISMNSTSVDSLDFVGDRSLLTKQEVNRQYRGQIESNNPEEGEMRPEERPSGSKNEDNKKMYDTTWVWSYYLPRENLIVVIADGEEEPLEVKPWYGPEGGPYRFLRLSTIAHELLPSPIGQELYELANLIGILMRKLGIRARDLKEIPLYEDGAEADATRLTKAKDNVLTRVKDLTKIGSLKLGGNVQELMSALVFCLQRYNELGGNLDALAGLGPQSETLGQDEMLTAAANAMIDKMRQSVLEFAKEVVEQIAWYTFFDPFMDFTGTREMNSVSDMPVKFNPEARQADYMSYNFEIEPFSMRPMSPEQEFGRMMTVMDRVIIPLAQHAQQFGMVPAVEEFSRQVSKLLRIPYRTLWKYIDPTMQQAAQPGAGPGKSPLTHRINERISRPGTTPKAEEMAVLAANSKTEKGSNLPAGG